MAKKDLGASASIDDHLMTSRISRGYLAQCKVGEWTRTPGVVATGTDMVDNMMYGTLLIPGRTCTVDQMACNVTAAGSTLGTNLFRLGIYTVTLATNGTMSAALLSDAGTVAYGTTGVKTVTLGAPVQLKYGVPYMLVIVSQGVPVTNPDIAFVHNPHLGMSFSTSAAALSSTGFIGWQVASIVGALPAAPVFVPAVTSNPLLAIRCSA